MIVRDIKSRVVGVDVSYERTTYAVVDVRGNILAKDYFVTNEYPDIREYVRVLATKILELIEANGGYETVRSIGISAPSANPLTGSIENSPNMPWKGVVPLAAMLRDSVGMAVVLGNDAHLAALCERAYGIAHGMNNFIAIKLGYGLGSCFFSNGYEHRGYRGTAGEFGHTCMVDNGRLCKCGKCGCLEAYTANDGIIQTAKELMAESDKPSKMRSLDHLSPRTIAECCDLGDELAIEAYRRTGYLLGLGLANYASLVSPEAIILTGGISHAGKWLLEPLNESFESHVFANIKGQVKIIVSKFSNEDRDVLGASALAWEVPEYSLFT